MKISEKVIDEHYFIDNYPKLDIPGVKPSGRVGDIYKIYGYI